MERATLINGCNLGSKRMSRECSTVTPRGPRRLLIIAVAEYELIYRFFARTLIHERRYIYSGQTEDSFGSYFEDATTHYFENQLANFKHFGLPQPQKGSFHFRERWQGRERMGIYMDDLFLCPKCGSFFFEDKPIHLFDLLRNRSQ